MISIPHVHFVGIGGIGMSGLARVLLEAGYRVSGSDRQRSRMTDHLASLGAVIHEGHRAGHQVGADLVVISSAIPADNPELVAAWQRGVPVVKRAELLGHLTQGRQTIAVAGTHGKTTTTGMISWILEQDGLDPTIFVGGELINLNTNAKRGQGEYAVVEADEYDYAFLELRPAVAVITNIEVDHVDIFDGLPAVVEAFGMFLDQVQPSGCIVACADDPRVTQLVSHRDGVVTYGIQEGADWQAREISGNDKGQTFCVQHHGQSKGEFQIKLPGVHSVSNALAAMAAAQSLGVDLEVIRYALTDFLGTRRRFEVKGVVQDIVIIDDYAHHPTEVRATLAAARQRYTNRTIWAVFQPHTFSRTRAFLDDIAASFADADHVIITDIYAAREKDTLGVHAADLASRAQDFESVRHEGQTDEAADPRVQYIAALEEAAAYLAAHLAPGHVVLTLGAGDVWQVGERILKLLTASGSGTRITEAVNNNQ